MDKNKPKFRGGYGKPPHETRFKPGQSDNPGGRPKMKAITWIEAFARELNAPITVTEGGKSKKVTKFVAIAKLQTKEALKGNPKAIAALLKVLESGPSEPKDGLSPMLIAMRAIHARHEMDHHNGVAKTASGDLKGKVQNDGEEKQ